jgi:hypothetical protein
MKIKDQVCTPEQAIKLKALGIDQRATYYHTVLGDILHPGYLPSDVKDQGGLLGAAYTVAELGMMLPAGYDTMRFTDIQDHWFGYDTSGDTYPSDEAYDTEAEARGAMLVLLLENKTITAEDVNYRLNQIR